MNFTRFCFVAAWTSVAFWSATASAVLTGEYLFESNVNDTSTFARHGTAAGAPTYATGLYTGSSFSIQLNTNGVSSPNQAAAQSVILPAATDFVRNAPAATLMAWVRLDGATGNRTIISINNGDTASGGGAGGSRATLQLIDGGANDHQVRLLGRLADGGGSSTATSGATALNFGQTYFLAGVFNYAAGNIQLYLNGQPAGSATVGTWATNSANTANLVSEIGSVSTPSAANQEFWPGLIDGVRIYDHAVSAADIFNTYLAEAINPFILGDTDGDGTLEASDLTPIRQNYRMNIAARSSGDLVDDDVIDFKDFRQWKNAWIDQNTGSGGGSLAGFNLDFLTGAVPEPSSIALALVALCGLAARRSRTSA